MRTANSVASPTSAAVSPMRCPISEMHRHAVDEGVAEPQRDQIADVADELAARASGRAPTVASARAIGAGVRVLAEDLRAPGRRGAACSSRNVAAATPITTISAAASRGAV